MGIELFSHTPTLVAFGIPTVDYSAIVRDTNIITKYDLDGDNQTRASEELMSSIKNDIAGEDGEIKLFTGGCSQNTLIVFQNLTRQTLGSVMVGAVGNDRLRHFLQERLESFGVQTRYEILEGQRTANTIIIVHEENRCIVACNGAGEQYNLSTISNIRETLELAERSKVVLFEGLFVAYSFDIASRLSQRCSDCGNVAVLSLATTYVLKNCPEYIEKFFRMSDIIVGNRKEFGIIFKFLNLDANVNNAMRSLIELMSENQICEKNKSIEKMNKWKKVVIITDGNKPIICAYGNKIIAHRVPNVKKKSIVDTTGAGDSFLGGFLYGLIKNKSMRHSLEIGCQMASVVIRQQGCYLQSTTYKKTCFGL